MNTDNLRKYVLPNLPYVPVFWFADKLGEAWRLAPGEDALDKLIYGIGILDAVMAKPLPSLHPHDLLAGAAGAAAVYATVYFKKKNARKWRKDREYGSARWGTPADIKPYMDEKPEQNIILTATEGLTMNSRPKKPKYARNKNVMIVGGSGSGKTRFWLKPNLMQLHSSYVITDPKGTLILECGRLLQKNGYRIKILNTIDFKKSMHYNPFAYIRSEKDILKLVTALIANTKGEGKSGEDFWVKAETLLYCALIGYIHYEAPDEERNLNTLVEMINAMEVREDDESFKNAVDFIFDALEEREPQHFAVRQYKKYKLAAGKTAKSILISCGARLAPFDIKEMRELIAYDEMELDTLGDRKTALFVIISDTDDSFSFIAALLYSQMFNLLCDKADNEYGGRLPVHVRCLLDEFANIGQIPKFEKLIATIRSREISACVILQAQSQLKAIYKDNAETIIGNMDTRIFLGGSEKTTLKDLTESLGKETIDMLNSSITKGNSPSYGQNYQKLGRELMALDELAVMDGSKCILQLRGVRPFFSDKYDITQHKNYKYLSDANPKNIFSIERFLSTSLKVKPDEEYEVYEFEDSEAAV
ncbi:VirD4-like conjugal transfer protein, CD1115 family [Geosporobacter ferrireducens]|jgi:type IV secretion system protein VirD4|uniref:Conjugal transfer protein TraG n=1 Tax=Geosporobacter ferrireducens TaxID=1424294 RepID=A0A1D8GD06_9FIRM|nr:type IV secretory system conjugative DNA transfer family protein [Geosporobacter ferrireducens]AOT68780.1 conjugal transfer protein TraG [Geosporobacter ferrireducens]